MKKRYEWTERDILALKKRYNTYPYQKFPKWLLARHSIWSCYEKASTLKFARGIRNSGLNLKSLTVADRAYIAGIIDGEGSIIMNYNKPKTNPAVLVANTHKGLLEWIQKKFTAGQLAITYRDRHNPKWKDVYQLHIHGVKNVYDILRVMEKYLIIKKDKCVKAISFLKRKYSL